MQLSKPKYQTRTVVPLPDVDPEFSVTLRSRISDSELNRIYDRNGYIPGHEKRGGMGRFSKVLRDIVCASVERVNGATDAGEPLDPHADETKLRLVDTEVEVDGERKTLWQIVQEMAIEADRGDEKNSQKA